MPSNRSNRSTTPTNKQKKTKNRGSQFWQQNEKKNIGKVRGQFDICRTSTVAAVVVAATCPPGELGLEGGVLLVGVCDRLRTKQLVRNRTTDYSKGHAINNKLKR
jgi:hypothetical protein